MTTIIKMAYLMLAKINEDGTFDTNLIDIITGYKFMKHANSKPEMDLVLRPASIMHADEFNSIDIIEKISKIILINPNNHNRLSNGSFRSYPNTESNINTNSNPNTNSNIVYENDEKFKNQLNLLYELVYFLTTNKKDETKVCELSDSQIHKHGQENKKRGEKKLLNQGNNHTKYLTEKANTKLITILDELIHIMNNITSYELLDEFSNINIIDEITNMPYIWCKELRNNIICKMIENEQEVYYMNIPESLGFMYYTEKHDQQYYSSVLKFIPSKDKNDEDVVLIQSYTNQRTYINENKHILQLIIQYIIDSYYEYKELNYRRKIQKIKKFLTEQCTFCSCNDQKNIDLIKRAIHLVDNTIVYY